MNLIKRSTVPFPSIIDVNATIGIKTPLLVDCTSNMALGVVVFTPTCEKLMAGMISKRDKKFFMTIF